ncbi:hypothetical protein OESDEN_00738 [Oesophagostomum dentatum]|uniref:Neurotransmitter-gated ion-channel transmembrane region n=1 Tax=Oesophagostomum dentatum TaxID=61180 RepID=A0A0B1TPU4_OESDE|nr:hypothetical protein OESDEN_00738 [Oesophagostomum dentatum]
MMTQSFSAYEYGINATIKPDIVEKDFIATVGNAEWRILNISVNTTFYDTGDYYSYEMNRYVVQMKRNPSFYITMIITPSFVINILSIFGVFLKSADSMGKLGMALTNIMSLTFILGILATALPKTEGLPKIAIYVMVNLFIMVFALTATLFLPYLKRYLAGRVGMSGCGSEKKKRKDDTFYYCAEYGLCALLEIANLINFVILVT